MYSIDKLSNIAHFKVGFEDAMFDSLTKTISRQYMVKYIRSLIKANKKFTLLMIDLDNFKLINDSYGHLVGDIVLSKFAKRLSEIIGDQGIIGRFGGDEFLCVINDINDYDEIWKFIKKIYNDIRRDIVVNDELSLLITLTTGSSSFPQDGSDYQTLFNKADKALYRGKTKGRNCFIIYKEDKHSNINVTNKINISIVDHFHQIKTILKNNNPLKNKIKSSFTYLCNFLSITGAALVLKDGTVIFNTRNINGIKDIPDISEVLNISDQRGLLILNDYSSLKEKSIKLHTYCWDNRIKSLISYKIERNEKYIGNIFIFDSNIKRIWQNENIVLLMYLGDLIGELLND